MTRGYKSLEKTAVVLNDLIKINDDRIACYEQALNSNCDLNSNVTYLFAEIIREANDFRDELMSKVAELDQDPKNKKTLSGLIHRAWTDLKVTFNGTSSNAVMNFCVYNEEIAQHTYRAAINLAEKIDNDVRELIMHQQEALKRTYELVRNYKQTRSYSEAGLSYFN